MILFGFDKGKAKYGSKSRISETGLLFSSFIGGVVGGLIGMKLFRHKTGKTGFKTLMFVVFLLNIVIYGLILYYYVFR